MQLFSRNTFDFKHFYFYIYCKDRKEVLYGYKLQHLIEFDEL